MIYHLKSAHGIVESAAPSATTSSGPAPSTSQAQNAVVNVPAVIRQKTLADYFQKSTLEEEIARMVAMSNISFNQIAKTQFIRQSLAIKYSGRVIPAHHQGIANLMMKFFAFAEDRVKEQIKKLKAGGKKFSATLDEWTSCANYRYLNINLHYTTSADGKTAFVNLGLIKILDRFSADKLLLVVRKASK